MLSDLQSLFSTFDEKRLWEKLDRMNSARARASESFTVNRDCETNVNDIVVTCPAKNLSGYNFDAYG